MLLEEVLKIGHNYAIIGRRSPDLVASVADAAWKGFKVIVIDDKAYMAGDNVEVEIVGEVSEEPWCMEGGVEVPTGCLEFTVRGRIGGREVVKSFNRLDKAIDWVVSEALRWKWLHA